LLKYYISGDFFRDWFKTMNNKTLFFNSKQTIVLAFFAAFLFCNAQNALAIPPGCDKKVFDVGVKQAESKVAYDVASAEQTLESPPSVLAMTCFGKAVSASNEKSSLILSGDFFKSSGNKIKDTFKNVTAGHLKNFPPIDGASDDGMNFEGNPEASLGKSTPYKCDGIAKVADKMDNEPLKEIPSFEDLTNDINKSGREASNKIDDFQKSWDASSQQGIVSDAKNEKEKMKQNDSVVSFTQDETPCQILLKSGLNISCNDESNSNSGGSGGTQ